MSKEHSAEQGKHSRHIWNLFANPIFIMGCRLRLRSRQAIASGTISFTIAAFIFFAVYLTAKERGVAADLAAKGSIIPLFIFQGLILMLLGTGSVASGIALDRDKGTLNFQRMTPMSPASKILGYLFGLPSRQYMMFLLTMPFLIAAVVISKISVINVLHFYLVFLTTVWLYHMIGMVSGMIAPRPRRVGMIAMVVIVLLYWIMPQFSSLGFTFFGFVTVIPTFQVLLASELAANPAAAQKLVNSGILRGWQDLQFFQVHIHPTTYTILIQGMLLLTCFVIVYRKWHREESHALPKAYALGLFAWIQFLLLGSLWPFLSQSKKLMGMLHHLGRMSPALYSNLILFALFGLSGVLGLLLIYIISPTWFTYLKGLRRAKKSQMAHIPLWSDAASSFWFAIAFALMTSVTYAFLLRLIFAQGKSFARLPSTLNIIVLPLLFTASLLGLQALRERLEKKGFIFLLFFLWIVPIFVAVIMVSAFRQYVAAAYVMTINPVAAVVYALQNLNLDFLTQKGASKYAGHIPTLSFLGLFLHSGIAIVSLWLLRQKTLQVREGEERRSTKKGTKRGTSSNLKPTLSKKETKA